MLFPDMCMERHTPLEGSRRKPNHGCTAAKGEPVDIVIAEFLQPARLFERNGKSNEKVRTFGIRFDARLSDEEQIAAVELADLEGAPIFLLEEIEEQGELGRAVCESRDAHTRMAQVGFLVRIEAPHPVPRNQAVQLLEVVYHERPSHG